MSNWIRKNAKEQLIEARYDGGLGLLKFKALEEIDFIKHAFSTRSGGVSEGYLSSMNLSFTREDNQENVIANYKIISEALGIRLEDMVLSMQTHTTNILKVTKEHRSCGLYKERSYTDIDGLITDENDICLVTFFADCVPLYFVDSKRKAIGLAHSGWRGTYEGMAVKMIEALGKAYNTKPEELIVCIGPSICADCYEVDTELGEKFRDRFSYSDTDKILRKKDDEHYHLNLWEANKSLLIKAGVKEEHIHITDICTHCNPDKLYSHRYAGEKRGNMAAFLSLSK